MICGGKSPQLTGAAPHEQTLELPVQKEQPTIAIKLELLGEEAISLEYNKRYYVDAQNN